MRCDRCGKESDIHILSMFSADELCIDCKEAEKLRPDYKDAVAADENAIRGGDMNFPGIGLGERKKP